MLVTWNLFWGKDTVFSHFLKCLASYFTHLPEVPSSPYAEFLCVVGSSSLFQFVPLIRVVLLQYHAALNTLALCFHIR